MACRMYVCLLALVIGVETAWTQGATATLSGVVVDETNAVLPDTEVRVMNTGTMLRRETKTGAGGGFTFTFLPIGRYIVTVQRQGFTPIEVPNIVLNVNDQISLRLQLKVASVGEQVSVVAEPPRASTSPEVSTVIDRQFVENLPLNGRSFHSLLELTPGVVLTTASGIESGQFSVNGQRANANYFMVDGVSANIAITPGTSIGQGGAGSLPGLSASGGTSSLVSVDALQEFRVLTSSYAPEFGRTPGGQVSISTRSGTNAWHGTLFDYVRNEKFDANDWFANSRGAAKSPLRQNDFGGVFGGPIVRNRSFFFLSYEGLRLRLPQFTITEVPSLAMRQAVPAAIQPFLDAFPLPTGPTFATGLAELAVGYSLPSTSDATSLRVDHAVRGSMNVFGRFVHAPSDTTRRTASQLSSPAVTSFTTRTFTAGATNVLTSRLSNELRVNVSSNDGLDLTRLDDFGGAVPPPDSVLFPPYASRDTALSQFNLNFGVSPGMRQGLNANNIQRQLNIVDNVAMNSGRHDLKFGVDYRRLTPVFGPLKYAISAFFTTPAAVLAGIASTAQVVTRTDTIYPIFTSLSVYAQDTWRATARMTATYGVRWEYNGPPSEKNGRTGFALAPFGDPSAVALAPEGTRPWSATYNNFAPRAGLAYQLSMRERYPTTIRGGVGKFYDLGYGGVGSIYQLSAIKSIPNAPYPLDAAAATPPPLSRNYPLDFLTLFDPSLRLPYTNQWNLAIEQGLGRSHSVSVAYVGAAGRRLIRNEFFVAPNRNFTNLTISGNKGTSDYHSLQVQFDKRLSNGFQALGSYTLGHCMDTASNDSRDNAWIDPATERGPCGYDVRHSFSAAATYALPATGTGRARAIRNGWAVDGIFRARSATPVNIFTGTVLFNLPTLLGIARPDVVPGAAWYLDDPTAPGGRVINRAAFTVPVGRQGNLGRNALRGFAAWQFDLAVHKDIDPPGIPKLQFRAEFFNALNHPNFGNPNNTLNSATFGRATTMLGRSLGSGGLAGGFNPLYQIGGPRSIQLSLKLRF
jgi:hypothetical protein